MLILPRVYASIKILVFLSGQPNYQATTTVISQALRFPLPACRKTAWQLKLAGVLSSSGRGPRGIKLARPPNEIWIGKLVRSLEDQRTPLGCEHEIERMLFFADATERFFEVLDSCTVMDICLGNGRTHSPQDKRLAWPYRPSRDPKPGDTDWGEVLGRGHWSGIGDS